MLNQSKFKTYPKYLLFILLSIIYADLDYGVNHELRYANGELEGTNFFENYFDVNIYHKDIYIYSLLMHKNPPLVGLPIKKAEDMLSTIFLEYYNDKMELQVGDIYQSYGAGLSMHTFEERNIDYNNSPRGMSILYYFRDNIDLFATFGENTFSTRTNPAAMETNIFIKNDMKLAGFTYQNDYFDMHYLSMVNKQKIDSTTIENMITLSTPLGYYLDEERYPSSLRPSDFSMKVLEHNLGGTFYLGDLELYFEKTLIYHNKIEAERTKGYKYYFSSYLSLSDYGILYEYKDYNSPYYFSVYSNPPIVFRESSSTLISRNLHNTDFSNEVGHHILINKSFSEQINILFSTSFSYNPVWKNTDRIGIGKIFKHMFKLNTLEEFANFTPYRQFYFELNGWTEDGKIAYKVGFDDYFEYVSGTGKEIQARTCPSQITYQFSEGNSITAYIAYQKTRYFHADPIETHRYFYFSPSYNHFGKWIVSLFGDFESKKNSSEVENEYFGLDITYYRSNSNIVSLFFGSQKGGLVCANGTCVIQPDFKNGFKITSKRIF